MHFIIKEPVLDREISMDVFSLQDIDAAVSKRVVKINKMEPFPGSISGVLSRRFRHFPRQTEKDHLTYGTLLGLPRRLGVLPR